MSHIPNSAMPHAGAPELADQGDSRSFGARLSERAGKLSESARAHPGVTAAAGAAVFAGAIAAAAIPLMRSRANAGSKRKSRKAH